VPRIAPARPRSTSTAIPGGLRVVIPARRRWLVSLFLGVWMCGWTVGEVTALGALFAGKGPGLNSFLLVWLVLWTLGGAFAATALAWNVAGREVVSVSGATLTVRREVLGVGRTSEYDAASVRNLRVAPQPFDPFDFRSGMRLWGLGGGVVAFDYGAATHRFGAGVEEAEGAEIVRAFRERLPAAT